METDKIHSFDDLFTTDHIRILKIFLSYLNPPMQGRLAVIIRFRELLCALRFAENAHSSGWSADVPPPSPSAHPVFSTSGLSELLNEIFPYCDKAEQERVRNLQTTFRSIENIKQTMELFEMMQELMPEFFRNQAEDDASGNTPFGFDLSAFSQMMDMMRE